METHVPSALFLYVPDTEELIDHVVQNPFNIKIEPVLLQQFLDNPEQYLPQFNHVVIAAPLDSIKSLLALAMGHDFNIGIITTPEQRNLRNCYGIPKKADAALDLALQENGQVMDIILCNKQILVFKAAIGRLPLIDSPANINLLQRVTNAFKQFIGLRLLPFQFTTGSGKNIKTAASGCMIVQHHERTLASKLISHDSCLTDGMISMVITAPLSITDYFSFLIQTSRYRGKLTRIPSTIGYIKSSQITIETEIPLEVSIDGENITQTPLHCETIPKAVRINVGERLSQSQKAAKTAQERLDIKNLPLGKELAKAVKKRIPFFSYASEERFRDLFLSLREDARMPPTYLALMVLSTMLATVGLYQSSTAVVIGAMLLAPLMAPIVALAMGLLRQDTKLSKTSMMTIATGILIALTAAGLISLLSPQWAITQEMQARLNPSLLDLAVAIIAGVAGAYTKSNKKILQSLAGVSIAVALVPPLAVAGIGLGLGDLSFFSQAFLLFSTNLIGITLAAAFTFRILGFSPAVRNKKGIALITLLLIGITIPLYLSYNEIVKTTLLEKNWQYERFLVNDKYLIVQQAELIHQKEDDLLFVEVLVREPLTRADLNQLRKKIQSNFANKLTIRVQVIYIP
jgi:uncharacterized hydrophobic protein (TIGR00271 family)